MSKDLNKDSSKEGIGTEYLLSEDNIETLLNSYLRNLIDNNAKNTMLWYGRVSENMDGDWYNLLKKADDFHRKIQDMTQESSSGHSGESKEKQNSQ